MTTKLILTIEDAIIESAKNMPAKLNYETAF